MGEQKFRQLFAEHGVRVDGVLEAKEVQIDLDMSGVSMQQYAVEKLKTNRCAEIHHYLETEVPQNYHFCILQTWGGKERFGILDALPVKEMADRVIQPKNFVVDAREIFMYFLKEMKA